MNLKLITLVAVFAIVSHAAVVPLQKAPARPQRQGRTLGIVLAGANAVTNGLGAVGSAAASAAASVAAAKPLILLGLGKYALWNYLSKQQQQQQQAYADSTIYYDTSDYNSFQYLPYDDSSSFVVPDSQSFVVSDSQTFEQTEPVIFNNDW